MLTIKTIMSSGPGGDWFVTIDLKDAYFSHPGRSKTQDGSSVYLWREGYQYKSWPSAWLWRRERLTKCMELALAPLSLQGMPCTKLSGRWLILAHSRELVRSSQGYCSPPTSILLASDERQEECAPPISANHVSGGSFGILFRCRPVWLLPGYPILHSMVWPACKLGQHVLCRYHRPRLWASWQRPPLCLPLGVASHEAFLWWMKS